MAIELDRGSPDGTGRAGGRLIPEQFARTESSAWPRSSPAPSRSGISDVSARLIKDSFSLAMADPPKAMEYFYARLFVQNPEIRVLFPLAMTQTRLAAFDALARLIRSIDSPQVCEQFLSQLACDHRKFGVKEKHYQPFFDTLLATVEQLAGPAWTPETTVAWQGALDYFGDVMRAAAAQDAVRQPAWWVGEIVQHDQRTATIAVLTIRPDKPLEYLPGQYISVQVPRWPKAWRTYSIANAPRDNGLLDIHVRAVPGGVLSTALVSHCGTTDALVLGPARGDMRVEPEAERDLVCVAGGTGLAPVKAIIESVICATRHGRRRAITLYLGVRRPEDLYDMRDLNTLQLAYPSLTVTAVTGPERGAAGLAGGLDEVVGRHPSFRDTDVYISGPWGMVCQTIRVLSRRVPADRLHHDPLHALRAASRPASEDYLSR
ncbi:MAG TPA: globin domain-containing protein [Streptosporangiaceae bacterium]|nr:globin domain-containing protein [Streptosporangiaceae bacterium]